MLYLITAALTGLIFWFLYMYCRYLDATRRHEQYIDLDSVKFDYWGPQVLVCRHGLYKSKWVRIGAEDHSGLNRKTPWVDQFGNEPKGVFWMDSTAKCMIQAFEDACSEKKKKEEHHNIVTHYTKEFWGTKE